MKQLGEHRQFIALTIRLLEIEVFKIFNGYENIDYNIFFEIKDN